MSWRAAPFDPGFLDRSPLFWPIADGARAFSGCTDWPPVATYERAFRGEPAVRFEEAPPRSRRRGPRREGVDPAALYDGRIAAGVVPTRPRQWHDFMNALVWAAFPRAKRALHARQHARIAARVAPGDTRLPGERTRELDALALLDEGGIVLARAGDEALGLVFGHAIYEGLAAGGPRVHGAACAVELPELPDGVSGVLAAIDGALAERIADESRLLHPSELSGVDVDDARLRAWG